MVDLVRLVGLVCLFVLIQAQNLDDELDKFKPLDSFVELNGGDFLMGINDREGVNNEYPQRKGIVDPFRMMLYPVSVASFRKYKKEKYRHRTDPEQIGSSWVFNRLQNAKSEIDEKRVMDDYDAIQSLKYQMVPVKDTRWNKPEGGDSTIRDRLNYPVVHVSYNDAFAYCLWKGMRLPTEIEWEFAARGGLKEKIYPWGDFWELKRTNLWQGRFPDENQERDGFYGLSPVDAFPTQNQYEMYDVLGNVWEWTSTIFRDLRNKSDTGNRRVLKGGSFLDNRDGEYSENKLKIRLSARIGRTPKYSAQNVGFRCVQPIKSTDKTNFNKDGFRVVRLRAPVHHRAKTHESEKTEL